MQRKVFASWPNLINECGAFFLLEAVHSFLQRNRSTDTAIEIRAKPKHALRISRGERVKYQRLTRAYEEMGMLMTTWYSDPRFLDAKGRPVKLSLASGRTSIRKLIRASHVTLPLSLAREFLHRSPSIRVCASETFTALRRVFVLSEFEIPRAAIVIERYLDTLQRNATGRAKNVTNLMLERSCHVSDVDLKTVAPILRDVKMRGSALIDSVDGDIEQQRLKRTNKKDIGEMGVLVFAWTKPKKAKRRLTVRKGKNKSS